MSRSSVLLGSLNETSGSSSTIEGSKRLVFDELADRTKRPHEYIQATRERCGSEICLRGAKAHRWCLSHYVMLHKHDKCITTRGPVFCKLRYEKKKKGKKGEGLQFVFDKKPLTCVKMTLWSPTFMYRELFLVAQFAAWESELDERCSPPPLQHNFKKQTRLTCLIKNRSVTRFGFQN